MDTVELSRFIGKALAKPAATLFAGAGVSCRAGYPTWTGYLEHLAQAAEGCGQSLTGALVRARAISGNYLTAATVFKTADEIPTGERWRHLAAPFRDERTDAEIERLVPLVSLGFKCIVTTNYDSALHRARAATGSWPRPVELGDGSLKGASLSDDFFIARIHGRAELPETMVVDSADYERVLADPLYLDFLLDLFRQRHCLFVGFSFADPAIKHVIGLYRDRFGPTFTQLHSAIIPAGSPELEQLLRSVNFDIATYSSADDHRSLWKAIRAAYENPPTDRSTDIELAISRPDIGLGRFMAFAYAQSSPNVRSSPVVEVVVDGLVLAEVATAAAKSREALVDAIRSLLRLSAEEAGSVVRESLARLAVDERVRVHDDGALSSTRQPHQGDDLRDLSAAVLDRMKVRTGRIGAASPEVVRSVLERMFLARAWDLAAHFAGAGTGWGRDLVKVTQRLIRDSSPQLAAEDVDDLASSVADLLVNPEARQVSALARVGRMAFGLQLVLASPRQALFQEHALPEMVYLDANVLLPAVAPGHPLQRAYLDSLRGLAEASKRTGSSLEVRVASEFLNEVVSHRKLALELVADVGLDDARRLRDHVHFYGAANTNVFVAAFASSSSDDPAPRRFRDFLSEIAPYTTEAELERFLAREGIHTVALSKAQADRKAYRAIRPRLQAGYDAGKCNHGSPKQDLLVDHEALQLAQLRLEANAGLRTVFVTADSRLRRILGNDTGLHDVAAATVSNAGLVALVEVMVGLEAETGAVARIMWTDAHTDTERSVFEFLVAQGLAKYREGVAMEMQEAARLVAQEAAEDERRTGGRLLGRGTSNEELSSAASKLSRYEDRFFEYWREAIEERERNS